MASNSPYRTNNFRGKFTILYEGHQDGFHCFRCVLRGYRSMEVHMFKQEIASWLLGCVDGDQFSGAAFGDSKLHPKVTLPNEGGKDFFVLLSHVRDAERFEDHFPVRGFSPTLVA